MKKMLSVLLIGTLIAPQIYAQEEATVEDAWKSLRYHASVVMYSLANAAKDATWYVVKKTSSVTVPGFGLYAGYWLSTAKTKQDFKAIETILAPINRFAEPQENDLICHWNTRKYPTAAHFADVSKNRQAVNTLLIELAQGVIGGAFNGINTANLGGTGMELVKAVQQPLLTQIRKEKEHLLYVIDSLRGKHSLEECLSKVRQLRASGASNGQGSDASPENSNGNQPGVWDAGFGPYGGVQGFVAIANIADAWWKKPRNYTASEGYPWTRWIGLEYLFGIKRSMFNFNYAEEFNIGSGARIEDGTAQTSQLTGAEYLAIDAHMKEQAKISNNKFKFVRGYIHYEQAALLSWSAYKKLHRLQVLEAFLLRVDRGIETIQIQPYLIIQ